MEPTPKTCITWSVSIADVGLVKACKQEKKVLAPSLLYSATSSERISRQGDEGYAADLRGGMSDTREGKMAEHRA